MPAKDIFAGPHLAEGSKRARTLSAHMAKGEYKKKKNPPQKPLCIKTLS